ncbi:MAG: tripartite tricarboxylate transporter substrate binding protein [Rhodocyclaceae bacterium]|nr:tripartite tricarboxylate transporter substrate binding protein [Rhodocyclaceae bacterium]MCA3073430.1 tripartite tricarboxylate transporter substrate binding protein [Rhodocyclaceae bacterium]MCA3088540.1 tripartite tricarboxylate transporter substrate binding protein [Rhodocyclaceae bacterium]MCA3092676.1 tripartite tricarboxylate transporter substrate binding protein [Rhodocyclaceae bacterium]MCA3098537.1 tripartite tricarboxylate transporter substrate binding protein [Rhodocyclaceae bact
MVPMTAAAQDYPSRPVRIVLGFAPGGVADLTSRLLAQQLGERTGQPFLVDNRPGAGGIIAAETVAKSAADGYTLLLITNGNAAAVTLMKSLPYDPVKDFAMIAPLASFELVIVTGRNSPIGSIKDILSLARTAPQKLNLGSINIGSTQHLATELFRAQAGVPMNAVTYKGTPALVAALQGDEVQVGFEVLGPVLTQITGGALRAIAVTAGKRFEGLPNVPTAVESGMPQYNVTAWNGVAAPARTPRAIVDRLNTEINAAIARPEMRKRMAELAVTPTGGTPEDMSKLLSSEIRRWGDVVTQAKIERQ